jgi:hypothetical protein
MKTRTGVAISAAAAALFLAVVASAQMGMGVPPIHGIWNPAVGSGAVYQIEGAGGRKSQVEYALIGKESVDGQEGYWIEMTFESPEGRGSMVAKELMVWSGDKGEIKRMITQIPGQQAMEVPLQVMAGRGAVGPSDIRRGAQDLGSESVTTPAGTFVCEHYRSADSDVWVSQKVAPFGMVRATSKDSSVTLTKLLADAKDKITGTPRKIVLGGVPVRTPN